MDDTPNGDESSDGFTVNWTLRRGVASTVTVVVVLLLVGIVWGASTSRGASQPSTFPTGLLAVIPQQGDQAPRQGLGGVSLSPGWQPALTIDGVHWEGRYSNGYAFIAEPPVSRWRSFSFPMAESEVVLGHRTREIRARIRGDEVIAMDSFGADLTFFDPFE